MSAHASHMASTMSATNLLKKSLLSPQVRVKLTILGAFAEYPFFSSLRCESTRNGLPAVPEPVVAFCWDQTRSVRALERRIQVYAAESVPNLSRNHSFTHKSTRRHLP